MRSVAQVWQADHEQCETGERVDDREEAQDWPALNGTDGGRDHA